jgi:predicted TIM-barrel fold metal-dependent hydrolase
MKIVDPHLHLFDLNQGDYHWLKSNNPPFWPDKHKINNSFNEQDLRLAEPLELAGFIHIEAGFNNVKPCQEISYLEASCLKPFHSIAAVDLLASPSQFIDTLETLLNYRSMVGVRHILDDEAQNILTNKQALINFEKLNLHNLIFETQLPLATHNDNNQHHTLNALSNVIESNRNITFIINHAGFPPRQVNSLAWQHWQRNLGILASYPNTVIKCSGWEMTDRKFDTHWFSNCLSTCIEIFSLERVMLASNFPLCLFSHQNYEKYWQNIIKADVMNQYNRRQKNALFCNNALKYYHLSINGVS